MYCKAAEDVVKYLSENGLTLSAAESCTGGKVSDLIISIPGASKAFTEGYITYTNKAKEHTLNVSKATINKHGAISCETAREMAKGAAEAAYADVGVSVTGNAGPTADEDKPVGLVYIGCFIKGRAEERQLELSGDRETIRNEAARRAVEFLNDCLTGKRANQR